MMFTLHTAAIGLLVIFQHALCYETGSSNNAIKKPERITIKYGPFNVAVGMAMPTEANIKLPCTDCIYTYLKGDMIDLTGKTINREDGAYLHHMTVTSAKSSKGLSTSDITAAVTGGQGISLLSKPIYLIGEERFAVQFPNAGVYVSANQTATLSAMIQNRTPAPIKVYITMDYEHVPGKPNGYVNIIPVPQNALGFVPLGEQKFTRTSPAYTSPQEGRILMMYGHLHDGGIHTEILLNNKVLCDSIAYYSDMTPLTTQPNTGHSHGRRDDAPVKAHITSFGECNELGVIHKGDKITTKVYYDFTKRPRDTNKDGTPADLMGISMTYIGVPLPK